MPDSPPALTVAAAARRLGVAPDTLRTWDRRYGLGPTQRVTGSHRRYSPLDLARLDVMRRLTLEGFPPREAARAAARLMVPLHQGVAPAGDGSSAEAGATGTEPCSGQPSAVRGLVRAAVALDAEAMTASIDSEVTRRGVVPTWDGLLVPALAIVGQRWANGSLGVEVEHLLSETVLACLRRAPSQPEDAINTRPVLAACAPDEQHSLPLFALAAALAERRVAVRVLGGRVPADALAAAVRRCGPAAVLVWSHEPETGDPGPLVALSAVRPPPLVLVGGNGWPEPLPPGVQRVDSLPAAVAATLRALGGAQGG